MIDVAGFYRTMNRLGPDVGPDSEVSFQRVMLEPVKKMMELTKYINDDARSRTYGDGNTAFANDQAAMIFQGPWALTAFVLVCLPLVGLAIALMSGPKSRAFLMSPWGIGVIGVASVLMVLAMGWMRYLALGVQRAARSVDPLVTKTGKQADPTAELIDLLALAMGSGMGPAQAFAAVSRLTTDPQAEVCRHAARSWHMAEDPLEAMPDALQDITRILVASTTWGAPVVAALQMQSEDLRSRANEAALEAAEGLSARLVLPTTLLLMPAFMLVMVVPVLAPPIIALFSG